MPEQISWDSCYIPSKNIVFREIDGELVIVPLTGGIGDLRDDLFTFNATGKAIWDACDGKTTLRQVVELLSQQFDAPADVIARDVDGLVKELCERDILVPRSE